MTKLHPRTNSTTLTAEKLPQGGSCVCGGGWVGGDTGRGRNMNTLFLIKKSSAQTSDGRLVIALIYEEHSTHTHAHTDVHTHTSTHGGRTDLENESQEEKWQ